MSSNNSDDTSTISNPMQTNDKTDAKNSLINLTIAPVTKSTII